MEVNALVFVFLIVIFSYIFLVNMRVIEGATSNDYSNDVSNSELMTKLNSIESKIDGNSCLTKKDVKPQVLK